MVDRRQSMGTTRSRKSTCRSDPRNAGGIPSSARSRQTVVVTASHRRLVMDLTNNNGRPLVVACWRWRPRQARLRRPVVPPAAKELCSGDYEGAQPTAPAVTTAPSAQYRALCMGRTESEVERRSSPVKTRALSTRRRKRCHRAWADITPCAQAQLPSAARRCTRRAPVREKPWRGRATEGLVRS